MKKLLCILLAIVSVFALAISGCKKDKDEDKTTPSIRLRSEPEQALKVGEKTTIVYSVSDDATVLFASSNPEVVSVDKFANVVAEGVGTAKVTLSLEDYPEVTEEVTFTVTKNSFMTANGYKAGKLNLDGQETGAPVYIEDGQAQLLANAAGQNWYFKCKLTRTGCTGGDTGGGWGVGSFLVTPVNSIGEVMYWYAMRYQGDDNHAKAYYGGWRYASDVPQNKEAAVNDTVYDISEGVDFTIIRKGITHYVIGEFKGETVFKHSYDVPLFEGKATYPGVFGQNQKITVSNYEMSDEEQVVNEQLSKFQLAETISINGYGDTLYAGVEYDLTSTVLPAYTIDKGVTYSLTTPLAGVSLTPAGKLTIAAGTEGSVTVKATANSDNTVTDTKTYTVAVKGDSTSTLFETSLAVGSAADYSADGVVTAEGNSYVPLNYSGEKWVLTATVENKAEENAMNGSRIGLMGATAGFTNYVKADVAYRYDNELNVTLCELGGNSVALDKAVDGPLKKSTLTLTLAKSGADYYLSADGKLLKKLTATSAGEVMPVLYSEGASAQFTSVTLLKGGDADDYVNGLDFYAGRYVTKSGNAYVLAAHEFVNAEAIENWPPVNDYEAGLKSAQTMTSNFSVEFTMSEINPIASARRYDGKVLVYLKSESVTCSLQFVIKNAKAGGDPYCKFVCNLDDNTWTEYDLPAGVDILNGSTKVKVVRKDDCVELYLNDTRVYEGEAFMANNGYWSSDTVATPGIGTFRCGVTVTNPVITPLAD